MLIVVNVYLFWLNLYILSFLFICSHRGSLLLCHHLGSAPTTYIGSRVGSDFPKTSILNVGSVGSGRWFGRSGCRDFLTWFFEKNNHNDAYQWEKYIFWNDFYETFTFWSLLMTICPQLLKFMNIKFDTFESKGYLMKF